MTEIKNGYFAKLEARCQAAESNLCVGLDPDLEKIPPKIGHGAEAIFKFCNEIIASTAEYAAAFKANIAFFESVGLEGWDLLSQVMEAIPKDIPIIIDAKRGDIGSTGKHYAKSLFDVMKADAITVNPFMGHDSVQPFLDHADKGLYFLCITSNPGAEDFQTWFDLYLQVAKRVDEWNAHGNCGLVVGGTQTKYFSSVRHETPELPLLVPGVGAQGGEIEFLFNDAKKLPRHKTLVNVSRGILYASKGADFAREARKQAKWYHDRINAAIAGVKFK